MCRNPMEKEFLKSHDGLLTYQLACTGWVAIQAALIGAFWVSPQKAIVRFQKFFFQWISTH